MLTLQYVPSDEVKGLDSERLYISEMRSTKGTHQWHTGRLKRRKMKRTHLYIKVEESEK